MTSQELFIASIVARHLKQRNPLDYFLELCFFIIWATSFLCSQANCGTSQHHWWFYSLIMHRKETNRNHLSYFYHFVLNWFSFSFHVSPYGILMRHFYHLLLVFSL